MKTLLLMRHAKSSWGDSSLPDIDRPLNGRGKRDAPRMGRLLREEDLVPERILVSPARRARKTANAAGDMMGFLGEIEVSEALYGDGPDGCLDALRTQSDEAERVLLVGHNPDLEELVELLTGEDEVMPTAAVAVIQVEIEHWCDLRPGVPANLVHVWRPRLLD